MNIITMPLSELKHPESNVRIHSKQQIEEFIRSLNKFGQTRLAVIDENNTILIGNGMVEAMKQRGDTEVECCRREDLNEADKKKLMIADNKIFSLGIDDLETLNTFIEELRDDLDIPGYSEEVLSSMVATAEEITETLSTYGILEDEEIESIKESGKRKEEQVNKIQSNDSQNPQYATHEAEHKSHSVTDISENNTGDTIENNAFVICPKCGEKIWL